MIVVIDVINNEHVRGIRHVFGITHFEKYTERCGVKPAQPRTLGQVVSCTHGKREWRYGACACYYTTAHRPSRVVYGVRYIACAHAVD